MPTRRATASLRRTQPSSLAGKLRTQIAAVRIGRCAAVLENADFRPRRHPAVPFSRDGGGQADASVGRGGAGDDSLVHAEVAAV